MVNTTKVIQNYNVQWLKLFSVLLSYPEASYAYKMKKTIIPLLVEDSYDPDGWLGALVGMLLYYKIINKDTLAKQLPLIMKELGDSGRTGGAGRLYTIDPLLLSKVTTESLEYFLNLIFLELLGHTGNLFWIVFCRFYWSLRFQMIPHL